MRGDQEVRRAREDPRGRSAAPGYVDEGSRTMTPDSRALSLERCVRAAQSAAGLASRAGRILSCAQLLARRKDFFFNISFSLFALRMCLQLSRLFSSFSLLGHSQESEPKKLEVGVDSDSDEPELQPSFDQPSEVFQTAAEDSVQKQ